MIKIRRILSGTKSGHFKKSPEWAFKAGFWEAQSRLYVKWKSDYTDSRSLT